MMNRALAQSQQMNDKINRAIGYSIAFHVVIFALFAVRTYFVSPNEMILEDSIRVDIVALPDKSTQAQLPPEPIAEAPKPEPAPPEPVKPEPPKPAEEAPPAKDAPVVDLKPETPKINLNKAQQQQQAALKRLESLRKIEQMASQKKPSPEARPQPVKGNEISRGSDLRGIARLEHQNYVQSVKSSVKRHWNLPGWLATASLKAKVRLFLDEQGNVVKKQLEQSSGNEVYDERVLAAVEASTPLPRPPGDLVNVLSVEGIVIELVPEK